MAGASMIKPQPVRLRSLEDLADANALRSAIGAALIVVPIEEHGDAQVRERRELQLRPSIRSPLASPAEIAEEAAPFPTNHGDATHESFFPDWRRRLRRNLARRSDGRWD